MAGSELTGSYAYTSTKGIFYGPGCLKEALPKLVASLGGTRALVVTGKSLHTKVRHILTLAQSLVAEALLCRRMSFRKSKAC